MKVINFINPIQSKEAYDLLVECIFSGFEYSQTQELLLRLDYHIPADQFERFREVCDIMVAMDIGDRRAELEE